MTVFSHYQISHNRTRLVLQTFHNIKTMMCYSLIHKNWKKNCCSIRGIKYFKSCCYWKIINTRPYHTTTLLIIFDIHVFSLLTFSWTHFLTLEFDKLSKRAQRSDTISAAERYGGLHFPSSRPTIKLNSTHPAVCFMGRQTIILTICRKIRNWHTTKQA